MLVVVFVNLVAQQVVAYRVVNGNNSRLIECALLYNIVLLYAILCAFMMNYQMRLFKLINKLNISSALGKEITTL